MENIGILFIVLVGAALFTGCNFLRYSAVRNVTLRSDVLRRAERNEFED